MNFLVDAQLPPALCLWLEERGHGGVHVTSRDGMLSDIAVAGWAEAEKRILISKDQDFLGIRRPDRFAFLWLRCGNATNRALAEWLEGRWEAVENLLENGERLVELI